MKTLKRRAAAKALVRAAAFSSALLLSCSPQANDISGIIKPPEPAQAQKVKTAKRRPRNSVLPIYGRADQDVLLGKGARQLRSILQDGLGPSPGARVFLAVKITPQGEMSFLFGNYLKRSSIPEGLKSRGYRYEKQQVDFPADEINALLSTRAAHDPPMEDSMAVFRYRTLRSGKLIRDRRN